MLTSDWSIVVRGAQPLVRGGGFNVLGKLTWRSSRTFPAVKTEQPALSPRLLSPELKTHSIGRAVSQNETSLGGRASFRTSGLR